MDDPPRATVTLRSRRGPQWSAPLADEEVRRVVVATAEAIAERTGVKLLSLEHDDEQVTATLAGGTVVAVGFAAELRRITERWHHGKYGTPLWSDPC